MTVLRQGHRNTFNVHVPHRYRQDFQHQPFDIVVDDINKIPFYTPLYVKKPLLAIAHHLFGKSIFTEAGILAGSYVYGAEWLLNRVYKHTPFAVVSESTRSEFIERGFDAENISIIHNCIDTKQFPFALQPKYAVPTIAYFGRLKRYKSVHHVLEAFALAQQRVPEARLQIMGKGDAETALRDMAHTLSISDSVEFVGYVPEHEKAERLGRVHCVVNPSMKEGWGIINIEANACGVPVISANSPGLRDSVRHGESGLLYEYGDIQALAATMVNVLSNEQLRVALSKGAINFAQQFHWDNSAQKMIQRMEAVIASHALLS
jgi:glycosyltransferase involved in cell wall biosynthesis